MRGRSIIWIVWLGSLFPLLMYPLMTVRLPSALVSRRRCPGLSPSFTAICAGSIMPVTARPYFNSSSWTVWPPASTAPASSRASWPPRKNVGQGLLGIIFRQRLGKTGHVHGAPGFAPKSVDIGQSIGRRDAAKGERVIDDGREDVHGLHQGLARRHGEHHGVLVTGAASQHPGLQFGRSFGRKTAQKPLQGPWSQLGRSARGAGFFQQLHLQISVRTFHNEQSDTFTPTMRRV